MLLLQALPTTQSKNNAPVRWKCGFSGSQIRYNKDTLMSDGNQDKKI
eukprot:CCRYP_009751-RJ/>CCRYP_009751-RJ protein AED:0.48 eAED:0.48 QI:0/-1/0/1/-1/1/1/0/46